MSHLCIRFIRPTIKTVILRNIMSSAGLQGRGNRLLAKQTSKKTDQEKNNETKMADESNNDIRKYEFKLELRIDSRSILIFISLFLLLYCVQNK